MVVTVVVVVVSWPVVVVAIEVVVVAVVGIALLSSKDQQLRERAIRLQFQRETYYRSD